MVGNRSTSETGCRTTSPRAIVGSGHEERDRSGTLVHQVLAPHPVVAQHLAVIACVNDPGRAFQPLLGQRPQHRPDLAVQVRAHGQVGGDGSPNESFVEFFVGRLDALFADVVDVRVMRPIGRAEVDGQFHVLERIPGQILSRRDER